MGVERSVTRWYVQRQLLLAEIEMLRAKCEQLQMMAPDKSDTASMNDELRKAQEKLLSLGPCPKPMMG